MNKKSEPKGGGPEKRHKVLPVRRKIFVTNHLKKNTKPYKCTWTSIVFVGDLSIALVYQVPEIECAESFCWEKNPQGIDYSGGTKSS